MKPPAFDYEAPSSLDQVLDLLAEAQDGATLLAGGQSLIPLLNMRFARPELVIDINRVEGLDTIAISDSAVSVGATVRLATLEHDDGVRAALPVLGSAASYVAHPQIRARTTVGGTVSHADPSAEIPTVAVALGATIHLRSKAGSRAVPAEDFFESVFTTSKEPDEIVVSVDFPLHPGLTFVYDEISRRQGDFPFAGLCLGISVKDGVVTAARAAAAGVSEVPQRLFGLENALTGRAIADAVEHAADAASAEVNPPTDIHGTAGFRRGLLRSLVRRVLIKLNEEQS
ncbi:FAD binding domain-containing protein [Rhodococcus globerulus]|uniref:FAD binding domain-containing protein n=1 Tax=Rhodococcus globerulus TaxID=33008 RepID=UPI000525E3D9|nr:xanthine dehydrogenase family protein subunit M [Rhodococcus globerulus]PVX59533.1 carbon-monoxide dehydrogenase medium subunit [Rhodococcus globerulus]